MATVFADTIKNTAGTGGPAFTNGVVGTTAGTAAAAGSIGEVIEFTTTSAFDQATPTNDTYYDVTSASIVLTAGHWKIEASTSSIASLTAAAGKVINTSLAIRTGSTVIASQGGSAGNYINATTAPDTYIGSNFTTGLVNITGSTTYKMSIKYNSVATNAAVVTNIGTRAGGVNGYGDVTFIRAIRIR